MQILYQLYIILNFLYRKVQSTYAAQALGCGRPPDQRLAHFASLVIPIKVNIFAWRVQLNKLPTRLNLSCRGVEISSILCPICNVSVESVDHLLFACSLTRNVWSKVLRQWELEYRDIASYYDWLLWFNNIRLPKGLKEILEGVCYVFWWLLWRLRKSSQKGALF